MKCIGVDDILAELKFLRSLLEKPLKLVVEVNDIVPIPDKIDVKTTSDDDKTETDDKGDATETPKEVHIPAWDILDADFDAFPDLPTLTEPADVLIKDTASRNNSWMTQLAFFKEENEAIFVLTLTIALIVILSVLAFMIWFCCMRECLKEKNKPKNKPANDATLEIHNDVAPVAEAEIDDIDSEFSPSLFREGETWGEIFEPREVIEMQELRRVTTDL